MCPTNAFFGQGEANRLRSAFDVLDVDRDGKISYSDLRAFHDHQGSLIDSSSAGGQEETDMVIRTMMWVADSNKDGYVEYQEFEELVVNGGLVDLYNHGEYGNGGMVKVMEDAFRVMDRDGDGRVGYQDLKTYLSWAGLAARDEDVEAMISLAGGADHRNGGVTFEGFLKILAV